MDNSEQKVKIEKCAEKIIENKNENAELEKEEMSSSSMAKNMSDEIENPPNKKAKKSLKFGGWLPNCLDWFRRPELAQSSLSTSSLTFNQYCWPHLHGRKVKSHNINYLRFCFERDDEGNLQKVLVKDFKHLIPIADINPPEYITGFEEIEFCYINDQILQFMQAILPMLKDEIVIQFNGSYCHQEIGDNSPNSPFSKLIAMLAPKKKKLEFGVDDFDFMEFHQRFPNFIYGCQFISLASDHKKEFIVTSEGICFTTRVPVDLFVQWLNVPMENDGKPRILSIGFHRRSHSMDLIDQIKKKSINDIFYFNEFSKSTKPANFIFQLNNCDGEENYDEEENYDGEEQIHHGIEIFKIENQVTGEILVLHEWPYQHILIRFKKEGEKTQMREGVKKLKQESKTTIIIG